MMGTNIHSDFIARFRFPWFHCEFLVQIWSFPAHISEDEKHTLINSLAKLGQMVKQAPYSL